MALNTTLYRYALRLLGRRSYHSKILRQKLEKKQIATAEEIDQLIQKFKDYKYINDDDYIRYYIHDQFLRRPQGVRKVAYSLKQKGIYNELAEKELGKYKLQEAKFAQKALQSKERKLKASSEKKYEKMYRFLMSRGFDGRIAYEALQKSKQT